MNIIVQATAMAYIVSGENVVMREYSIKFILILKMEKNKQIYCLGILYLQTFLEGHYEIVVGNATCSPKRTFNRATPYPVPLSP